MELRIDAKEILRRVLEVVEPGEDIDEAILRTCKQRYPDNFMEVFPALLEVIDLVSDNLESTGVDLIEELVSSEGSMTINLHTSDVVETKVIDGKSGNILKDIPAGLREKFGSLLGDDAGTHTIEKTIVRRTSSGGREMLDCRCGYLGPTEDDRCPKCGKEA
ncbi:hypothetical protein ACFL6R_04105 [Gemmatimonadota bacterium]